MNRFLSLIVLNNYCEFLILDMNICLKNKFGKISDFNINLNYQLKKPKRDSIFIFQN